MTDSAARMLRHYGGRELIDAWVPRLTATDADALLQGTQWMTEKTGGSDVGAATTVARRDGAGTWRLWGDKWFCSNVNADVALTLARPEGAPGGTRGLAMFLVPRRLPDGGRNAWTVNRLKDKLGSRSMATGEVTYAGAVAWPVGPLDRGFRQMMEMVNVSRLSNALRAAALMRRAVLEAVVHARGRSAYGAPLISLPLLRSAILEMLLDSEAALSVALNAAAILDRWDAEDPRARPLFRIVTPLAKYWTTSRARVVTGEAMNVRGGNGYIEEWVNPRLLRDSYLGAIWEGAANVVALDVQRAVLRDGGLDALAGFVHARLDGVAEPSAKPWRDLAAQALARATEEAARWPAAPRDERELAARPVAETLYHVLATALLLHEGQVLLERRGDFRKLAVAALYARRWLEAPRPPVFTAGQLRWLDAALDWRAVPAEAVPAPAATA
jgi:alkylation response protein AidB-like acyl-CoA dehydrogenase